MNTLIKLGLGVIGASIVLLVLSALSATADPADLNNPPTEDWLFNSSKTVVINNKDWTIKYNITLTNGTNLRITNCDWVFDGSNPSKSIWIFSEYNCTLEIIGCTFDGSKGASGFYIEANYNLSISSTEIIGVTDNPKNLGGVSCYNNYLELVYVKLHSTDAVRALYTYNCPKISISGTEIYDCAGDAAYLYVGNHNPVGENYTIEISDSSFYDAGANGLWLAAYMNNGNIVFNTTFIEVHDIALYGIILEDGEKTYGQGPAAGVGSIYATFDHATVYNIGDRGFWLCSCSKVSGPSQMNFFNISIINSHVYNIENPGIYAIRYYSICKHYLHIENSVFEDIAMQPSWNRLSAIFWWRYGSASGGYDKMYVGNTTFRRCNPGALWFWDHGQGTYGVGGIIRELHFFNCTFTECTKAALFRVNDEGGEPGFWIVENCTFVDNLGHGIQMEHAVRPDINPNGMTSPHSMIEVYNSTFTRHGQSSLAVTSNCNDMAHEIGYLLYNCLIEDSTDYAIEIRPDNPKGNLYLTLNNTRINNTQGVLLFYDKEQADEVAFKVRIYNSSIENSTLSALSIRAQGTRMPEVDVKIENSTIFGAGREGVSIHAGPVGSAKEILGRIIIDHVNIEQVDGMGIKITNDDPNLPGDRSFWINDTTIYTAQRGLYAAGFSGEMWYSVVKDVLLEDAQASGCIVDLWYNEFKVINENTFKAFEEGEIHHYYELLVTVKWDTGEPAIGTSVEITDNTHNLILFGTISSPDGSLPPMTMNSYNILETGLFSNTPYLIDAQSVQVSKKANVRLDRNREVLIIMQDRIEPDIFILYPKAGHVQQSTTLQVRGTAWDYQAGIKHVLLSLDGVNWEVATGTVGWNHTFDVNMSLISAFSGVFNLRAKAVDYAGNERVAYLIVRIDPTPPELKVNFPYDGYITSNPKCWVRGVTEVGSTIKVNGIVVPVVVSMFSYEVTLIEGPNTISVVSIDPLGNIQIVRMTVTLDTQDPYFILISPEEDEMTNQDIIPITAQLEPNLQVTINGYPVEFGSPAYPTDTGFMEYNWTLEPGENYIVIRVTDKSGNILVIERVVTQDKIQPWLEVRQPIQNQVLPRPEVTVVGTVEATATVYVNDEVVTIQAGYFERVILALEGESHIIVRAVDPAGNEYNETITIFVDTEKPYIEITDPMEDETVVNTVRHVVKGTVEFQDEVTAETMLLNGLPYSLIDDGTGHLTKSPIEIAVDGTFSVPVDLMEGKNELVFTALDRVGNAATDTVVIYLDTKAPTLVLFIDPTVVTDDGEIKTYALTVNITGYTDPGSILTVNGDILVVTEDGEFRRTLNVDETGVTTINLVSVDSANNTRTIQQQLSYEKADGGEEDGETDWSLYALIGSIVFLIVVIIIVAVFVGRRSGETIEPERAMVAPAAPVVLEEPDVVEPEPEVAAEEEEEEEAVEEEPKAAPARPRPRRPTPRRPVAPPPEPVEAPEDEVDLSDRDAEADIGADETDQEGA